MFFRIGYINSVSISCPKNNTYASRLQEWKKLSDVLKCPISQEYFSEINC